MTPLAFGFGQPLLLLLLLLLPIAAWGYWQAERRRGSRLASAAVLPSVVPRPSGWRRHVGPAAYGLAIAALLVALARPEHQTRVPVEQAGVLLVTDRSGSMRARDVSPTRMDAAKAAAKQFLDEVPDQIRVGAIAFNHRVRLVSPLTTDRERVARAIDRLTGRGSTAEGDALAVAVRTLRQQSLAFGSQVPSAIILLSDGESVKGRDPAAVARAAGRYEIPIHAIALGTDDGVLESRASDGSVKRERVPPDRRTLREIADRSGGTYSDAPSAAALRQVYEELGSAVATEEQDEELAVFPVGIALLLVLGGAGASLLLLGRVL